MQQRMLIARVIQNPGESYFSICWPRMVAQTRSGMKPSTAPVIYGRYLIFVLPKYILTTSQARTPIALTRKERKKLLSSRSCRTSLSFGYFAISLSEKSSSEARPRRYGRVIVMAMPTVLTARAMGSGKSCPLTAKRATTGKTRAPKGCKQGWRPR